MFSKYGSPRNGFPSYVFAALPAASTFPDYTVVHLSDVGINGGSHWYAKSGVWYPVNGSCMLATSAVPVSVTGTTNKTVVNTFNIPGGLLGANGKLRVYLAATVTNSSNSKGALLEIGGVTVYASPYTSIITFSNSFDIVNRNSAASQFCTGRGASGGHGNTTAVTFPAISSINTDVDNTFNFSFTLANSSETATLEYISVELIK